MNFKPKQVTDLTGCDNDSNANRESVDDWVRYQPDQISGPEIARYQQDQPSHEGGHDQAVVAMFGDYAEHHDDEGARRPADLNPATAKKRDCESGDDCRDQSACRFGAGCNCNRNAKGQRHH